MARHCIIWALLLFFSCSSVFGMQGRGKEVMPTFYDFLGTAEQPPSSSSSSDREAYGELDGTMQSQQDDGDASSDLMQQPFESDAGPALQYQGGSVQHRAASIAELRAEIKNRVWKSFQQSWHETDDHYSERRKRSFNRFVKKQEHDQRLVDKFVTQYRGDEAAITAAFYHQQQQVVLRHRLSGRLHYAKALNRDQEGLQAVYDQVRDSVFESTTGVAARNPEPQEATDEQEDPKTLYASSRQLTMAKARIRRDLKAGVDPAIIERRMKRWKIESLEDGRSKGAIKTAIRKQLKLAPGNEAVRARARKYGMNPDVQPFRPARGPDSRPYNWQQHAVGGVGDSSSSASVVSPVLWEDHRVQDVTAGSAREAAPAFHWDLNGMPSP